MSTTKVNINGEEIEVNFETLSQEEAEKIGIRFRENNNKDKQKDYFYPRVRFSRIQTRLTSAMPLIATMAFLLLGFLVPDQKGWAWGWVVFFAIPLTPILFSIDKRKGAQKYIAAVTLIVIVAVTYLSIWGGAASWAWVLLFLIPISSILFS